MRASKHSEAEEPGSGAMPTSVARLSQLLLASETVSTALDLAATLVAATLPGGTRAGVTLIDPTGRRTIAQTHPSVETLDDVQYTTEDGPCLEAWRTRRVVRIDDLSTDARWPEWNAAAAQLGVRSMLSAPLVAGTESLGAIKAHSAEVGVYGDADGKLLTLFAEQAAVLVANVESQDSAARLNEQLVEALRTRDIIGQAKGVLLAQGAATEDEAFAMLVSASQRSNLKLREVARRLVESAVSRIERGERRASIDSAN